MPVSGSAPMRIYFWLGLAVAGLGVVQLLADRSADDAPVVLVAALACGASVALLPRALLWATLGVAVSVVSMVVVIEVPVFASFLAAMVASFTLALYAERRQALIGVAIVLATVVVVAVPEMRASSEGAFGLVYPVFYFGGSATIGWLSRQRAKYTQSLQDFAASLERERHQQAALAAAAERERLARDLHDVVSHGVSLMVVQAEAAREVIGARPEAAANALETIADTGRAAMEDLHRMLGVLRDESTDLGPLAVRMRAAGIDVRLQVDPAWHSWDEPVRAALFRVAQEAITNTLRHAEGASEVSIQASTAEGAAVLEVRDDGTGTTEESTGLGSGLSGLRDRIAALGGRLDAAKSDGGFAVRATVPLGRS
ncbi:histidine kinase [Xylanimonas cellulosilytica DSM 15894]|uniref:histidine kinase n=1 Tax=Xylanimonas cellulosilytica (strain DSM 15894 / JCM 12276 / CECT 5975 / KCTC 9989 / LMG 20990 / NBRC 107835 / XIL07) TaxID=446471 RepID=D1BUN8_XYLCX|nr:histidine kinase [Xylanimonas cellulosilytica]ACZ29279.1 histidine kinase [Xylanimonas cellulosilytica DSM 15894]